jgi:trehalose 6-phosphate synthase/phosphatase
LVSGLSSYLGSLKDTPFTESSYIWIGWPGVSIPKARQQALRAQVLERFRAWPVFLDEATMEEFYHGFCNKTIWPLFHYFPSHAAYEQASWQSYHEVNQAFCEVVLQIARPDDIIWIQDYHLMMLPQLLRERQPDLAIGFFLHIPFPNYEIFRLLPSAWRADLLRGMLGADLVGFHTYDDASYFLDCVARLLDLESTERMIPLGERIVQAGAFPISIDVDRFAHAGEQPGVVRVAQELQERLADRKVILSVDRLDYTKGILHRLQGYQIFLEHNPGWHGRVTMILVVVPSRIGVEQYQLMRQQIDETVGRLNGTYGSLHWTPIIYQYRYLPIETLSALYTVADAALITPLRDGMNLVAKEYVATRAKQTGVLILSEMAGAAKELTEAVLINPNNREEIAEAIRTALEMPEHEQIRRNEAMQARLRRYDVVKWANDFIHSLRAVKELQSQQATTGIGSRTRRAG